MSARVKPGSWQDTAWKAIDQVHASLPGDISFADRKKAIDAAYPFGQREFHPYKMWLKARRTYLARYDERSGRLFTPMSMSPLERAKARSEAASSPLPPPPS